MWRVRKKHRSRSPLPNQLFICRSAKKSVQVRTAMMCATLGRAPKERRCSVRSTFQQFSNLREAETKVPIAMMCQMVCRAREKHRSCSRSPNQLFIFQGESKVRTLWHPRLGRAGKDLPRALVPSTSFMTREEGESKGKAMMCPTICRTRKTH